MTLVVRPARPTDAAVIAEFNRLLAFESEDLELDAAILAAGVAAALADAERGRYFVAQDQDAILGQIMFTREWSDWRNGWIWWIQSVYVRGDCRGRGVFRRLHDHVRQLARGAGVVALRLYVEETNHTAREVYGRLGMRRTSYLVYEESPLADRPDTLG